MNVYNTTFRTGLASTVAKDLKGRGFKIKDVSNDPQKTLQMGTALIRYGEEGDLAAKIVAQHLPGATLRKDERAGTSVDVVIGNAYTALVPQQRFPPRHPAPSRDADGRPPLRVGRLEGSRSPARAQGGGAERAWPAPREPATRHTPPFGPGRDHGHDGDP